MGNPASMSVGVLVATAAVVIVLGAFVASFMGMFDQAKEKKKADWVKNELKPAVQAVCYQEQNPLPPDGKFEQSFEADRLEINENPAGEDGVTRFDFATVVDGDIRMSVKLADSDEGGKYEIPGCADVELTGSNIQGSGTKKFKVKPADDRKAVIEVS